MKKEEKRSKKKGINNKETHRYLDEQTMEKAIEPVIVLTGMQVAPANAATESTEPLHVAPVYCLAMTQ